MANASEPMSADAPDRPLLAIALMLGFCVLAPTGDAIAKLLGDTVPLLQLLLVRFGGQALLLAVHPEGSRAILRSSRLLRLTAVRAALHVTGLGLLFLALRFLPLADAIAIVFVMPFVTLALGHLFFGETVGRRRTLACGVGFAGTLLVVQPSFAAVGWPALLPLCVAVVFALFMLMTRRIAKEVDAVALQGVSGTLAVLTLGLLWLALVASGRAGAVWPGGTDLTLLALMATIGTAGHLVLTWSLRHAPASTLAPMQYLEIPFATALGFAIFGDWPNALAQAGIAITVGAGLAVIWLERRARPQAEAPPVPQSAA